MRPVALLLPALVLLAGCAAPEPARADVVASFYPLEYLAARIAGDVATVAALVPAGVEPHEYEPTSGDVLRVAEARLLVVQGASFESWTDVVVRDAPQLRVVVATEGLELRANLDEEEAQEIPQDPHTWLDPVLMQRMARNVEAGLAAAYPEHADAFAARTEALVADLQALHLEFEEGLADCDVRVVVTSHAAFGYMAARYRFEMLPISGLDPEAEPGPATIQRVVEAMRRHNITVVFFEELVSPAVAQAVAREANATTRVLSPIEGIPPEDAAQGADYLSRMRDDLAALRAGMRCR